MFTYLWYISNENQIIIIYLCIESNDDYIELVCSFIEPFYRRERDKGVNSQQMFTYLWYISNENQIIIIYLCIESNDD